MAIVVRPARRTDLAAIAAMAEELAAEVEDPVPSNTLASLGALILGPRRWSECLVATRGAMPVGYILLNRYFEAHTGTRHLKIADLFVARPTRNTGVGKLLFEAAIELARALNCTSISWEVWKENRAAYRFYERLGAAHSDGVSVMHFTVTER